MPLMQSREQNKKPQIITTKLSFTNKTKAPTAFLLTLSSNFKVSKLWNHSGEQTSHSCSHRAFVCEAWNWTQHYHTRTPFLWKVRPLPQCGNEKAMVSEQSQTDAGKWVKLQNYTLVNAGWVKSKVPNGCWEGKTAAIPPSFTLSFFLSQLAKKT